MKRALPLLFLLFACEGPPPVTPVVARPVVTAPPPAPQAPDPLGPKPEAPTPGAFKPPTPVVYKATNGMTVWLVERKNLPIVSFSFALPSGASADPKGKGGLALMTAGMLDEGAGARGALELARAIDNLGATIHTSADNDGSYVGLTVLKRNVTPAFALFGDVIARPRFDPVEWKRVHDLWTNDLKNRASDPDATARVIFRAALFGPDHPYGHPWDGTPTSAKSVGLADVKQFYGEHWRADRATLVAVGDITKEELAPLLEQAFGKWTPPARPAPAPVVPPEPKGPWPRVVMVDRPEAPQSIIAALRPGIAAAQPEGAPLGRVNTAIGGSFTSRLNQDLREERHFSYGARSRVAQTRGVGQVVAWAAVFTDKTGEAMQAMLGDLEEFAKKGLTDEEVDKTRSQARAELVETYESVDSTAGRLAVNAALGLPPDHEATASALRDSATKDALNKLAARFYDPKDAILVVVGPKAKIAAHLQKLGLPPAELRDAEGNVVRSGP